MSDRLDGHIRHSRSSSLSSHLNWRLRHTSPLETATPDVSSESRSRQWMKNSPEFSSLSVFAGPSFQPKQMLTWNQNWNSKPEKKKKKILVSQEFPSASLFAASSPSPDRGLSHALPTKVQVRTDIPVVHVCHS